MVAGASGVIGVGVAGVDGVTGVGAAMIKPLFVLYSVTG
jgi:hypothetical protein